jgi:4-amino-4-deoxy-L-arabinose transferase-like glycosyltransferase
MSKIKNNQHIIIPLVVFLIIFLVGLVIFDDYGISVDEMAERKTSLITFKYILTNAFGVEEFHEVLEVEPDLKAFKDQFYGVALQLPTIFIEYLSGFTMDIRTVTKMRHLWVFTNFYLSLIAFFFLLKKRFENWKIGLIGVIILVFSPRIFADSFYNIKDLLFLPWFIFAVFSFYRFINNPNILNALFFSIVSALLINTRIVGAIVPGFAGIYLIVKWIRHDISFKRMISISALIILSIGCLWTLFLPTSWDNPLETFKLTLSIFSKYSLKITELYFGKLVPSQNVPWHYVPVWISITTPIFYQLLFVIGNFCLFRNLKKSDFENQFFDISMVSFFFLPIITAIVLNSTIYNGWRHFYFIYFPFVYIACFTVYSILSSEKLKFKKVFSITAILSLIFTNELLKTV